MCVNIFILSTKKWGQKYWISSINGLLFRHFDTFYSILYNMCILVDYYPDTWQKGSTHRQSTEHHVFVDNTMIYQICLQCRLFLNLKLQSKKYFGCILGKRINLLCNNMDVCLKSQLRINRRVIYFLRYY